MLPTDVRLVPAGPETAKRLASQLRRLDVAEIWFSSGRPPIEMIEESLVHSVEAFEGWVGPEFLCVFGIGAKSILDSKGVPWMMGTDAIERHAVTFGKASKAWIDLKRSQYTQLENWVLAQHFQAIPWLRWLGFIIEPPEPKGPHRRPFCRFHMEGHIRV